MKLIKLIIGFCMTINLYSQTAVTHYSNHARYWYYRTRLRNDFLVVGSAQGMSIPMQERGTNYKPYDDGANLYHAPFYTFNNDPDSQDGQSAQWGDAMSDLGYYIGVLAMEYKMLKDNGQNTQQTLEELFYAMDAVNRLDYNGEKLWNQVYLGPAPISQSLNGFMARDDVDRDFVYNNFNNLNYYGNRGFCSKVKISNSQNYNFNTINDPADLEYKTSYAGAFYNSNHNQSAYGGSFLSQDNYYNILVGLALVRKYVESGVTFNGQTFRDGMADISQEAFSIAYRTFNYFKMNVTWTLQYPDGSNIPNNDGGATYPFAFAHSEAMCKLDEKNWGYNNPTENWLSFHSSCEKNDWLNEGNFLYRKWKKFVSLPARRLTYALVPHRSCNLGNLGILQEATWKVFTGGLNANSNTDVLVMNNNMAAVCACHYTFDGNETANKVSSYYPVAGIYHTQLLLLALHGTENCVAGFPYFAYSLTGPMIENAPCETSETSGPFNYYDATYGNLGPGWDPAHYEWSATSRLDHPNRRGAGNNDFIGEFNGIDYMFYHNLYYLARKYISDDKYNKMVDYSIRDINFPYPVPGLLWGNDAHPADVGAYEYMNVTSTLGSDANVTFTAGKQVDLKPGFTVANGANFHATINHLDCGSIFNPTAYPQYNVRQFQNYDSLVLYNSEPTSYSNQIATVNTGSILPPVHSNNSQVFIIKPKTTREQSENNKFIDNVAIYPNPSNGIFKLAINNYKEVKGYQVKDMLGNVIFKGEVLSFENEINLNDVSKGVYSIVIEDLNGNFYNKKAIIQ